MSKSNYQRTADWLKACGKQPNPEGMSVQIGCHMEEVAEFLAALYIEDEENYSFLQRNRENLQWLANKLKRGKEVVIIPEHLRIDALDALCDA